MIGDIVAMTPDDYQKWAAGQHQRSIAGAERRTSLRQPGLQFLPLRQRDARGPNLAQVYGSRVQLADGSYVTADDAFLARRF